MLRLAVTFILLLLMLFGATVWLLDLGPPTLEPERQAKQETERKRQSKTEAATSEAQELQEALRPSAKPSGGAPSFDIARIDPHGTSVFAGRAEPHSLVTVTADGKEVGTVRADENGEWTLTTDATIPNRDAKLALFKAAPGAVPRIVGAEPQQAAAKTPSPAPDKRKTAGAVASGMLKNLEGMVAAARSAAEKPVPATAVPPSAAVGDTRPSSSAALHGGPNATQSVPVPVTFVFNEATLTSDGQKAAALLLEYVQLKRFPRVTLTGHADERGSDDLNMGLSRERLSTVARFLRDGGFKGQLELVPKGKAEPYAGVVRGDFSQEDLWQLDRRVELLVSR